MDAPKTHARRFPCQSVTNTSNHLGLKQRIKHTSATDTAHNPSPGIIVQGRLGVWRICSRSHVVCRARGQGGNLGRHLTLKEGHVLESSSIHIHRDCRIKQRTEIKSEELILGIQSRARQRHTDEVMVDNQKHPGRSIPARVP